MKDSAASTCSCSPQCLCRLIAADRHKLLEQSPNEFCTAQWRVTGWCLHTWSRNSCISSGNTGGCSLMLKTNNAAQFVQPSSHPKETFTGGDQNNILLRSFAFVCNVFDPESDLMSSFIPSKRAVQFCSNLIRIKL